jgi:hypothetical protein
MSENWLIESPVTMVEGEVIAFSVDWLGASKVEDPDAVVYKNGQDITETVMVSGDDYVISNNVVTLKKITAGSSDGGSTYVVAIGCTVDSNTEIRKLLIRIVKANSEN